MHFSQSSQRTSPDVFTYQQIFVTAVIGRLLNSRPDETETDGHAESGSTTVNTRQTLLTRLRNWPETKQPKLRT